MKSRKVILGLTGIAVLSALSVIGSVVGNDVLAEVARTLLLAAVGLLVLDGTVAVRHTERQLRRVRTAVRKAAATPAVPAAPEVAPAPETAPATSPEDLLGAIRLLQAQYVGRLDRAQATLEAAAEELSTSTRQGD